MLLNFLAAVREKTRAEQNFIKEEEREVASFDKIPESDRLEDLEIRTLLNE